MFLMLGHRPVSYNKSLVGGVACPRPYILFYSRANVKEKSTLARYVENAKDRREQSRWMPHCHHGDRPISHRTGRGSRDG